MAKDRWTMTPSYKKTRCLRPATGGTHRVCVCSRLELVRLKGSSGSSLSVFCMFLFITALVSVLIHAGSCVNIVHVCICREDGLSAVTAWT